LEALDEAQQASNGAFVPWSQCVSIDGVALSLPWLAVGGLPMGCFPVFIHAESGHDGGVT
jgi:hypothetical protein